MYKKRYLEAQLIDSMDNNYITILLGARQTGKTSVLKEIERNVDYNSLFLDLDIFENKQIFLSYSEAIKYLKYNGLKEDEKFVLFLDEFHTVPGINKILKNIYDNNSNIKIFVTGSSSIEIVREIKESLAGRKRIFYMHPLTFKEFLSFKEEDIYQKFEKLGYENLPDLVKNELLNYVKEFSVFGGYPEVVLSSSEQDKKEVLRSIFDLFVKKDLVENLHIKNPIAIFNIFKYLAINTGSLINYTNLCKTNHLDINTMKRYISLLAETFVIKVIPPFFTNKNKELVKAPKIYFHDPGVRNYFLGDFTNFDSRSDFGFLIENFVLSELVKNKDFYTEIKYWRDKNGREIDFILEKDNNLKAIEIKCKDNINKKDLTNLIYFLKQYPKSQAYLINKNDKAPMNIDILVATYLQVVDLIKKS